MTIDEIVVSYIQDCRAAAQAEMRFFEIQSSMTRAIHHAALCVLPSGKRHPHQRRLRRVVLNEAERCLQEMAEALGHAPDFAGLHRLMQDKIGMIAGMGKLTVYDIAHRIGAFLGKPPTLVYLHAGTAIGARALGFRGDTVDPSQLPPAFSRLSAAEIEDCLCIYKAELRGKRIRTGRLRRSNACADTAAKPCIAQGGSSGIPGKICWTNPLRGSRDFGHGFDFAG
jgi:hypothetical protein